MQARQTSGKTLNHFAIWSTFFDIIRSARIENTVEYVHCMHYKCTIMAGKPTFENSPTIKERNKDYGES